MPKWQMLYRHFRGTYWLLLQGQNEDGG
jgi:hypothetical protein